jgi:hypothetical protein
MAYPVFEIGSIKERCNHDITTFKEYYKVNDDTKLTLTTPGLENLDKLTAEQLTAVIKPIVEYIDDKLRENDYVDKIDGNDYVDEISHVVNKDVQNKLWIARTYLFYQLLIFETVILQNEKLYNKVFTQDDRAIFPFRSDIKNELPNFKMGIFGSNTPTSDIDLGIQYSGNTLETPGLAYIVSRFESLFVMFTGKERGSLAYDIETYADMMTLPNPDKDDKEHPDYFYLDTSNFEKSDFEKMLNCAGKSIVRNVLLAYNDLGKDLKEIHNITFEKIINNINENEKKPILLDLKEDDNKITFVNETGYIDIEGHNIGTFDDVMGDMMISLKDTKWFDKAKDELIEFLQMPYDVQRYKYYEKVDAAESIKFEYTKDVNKLNKDKICEMMILIGDALTYRMESYTCAPTVVHVVRILQASKENKQKYATLVPKEYCRGKITHLDPFCSIGTFGYGLSILEQIGYIYRFYLTYCHENSSHIDETKCKKKYIKYMKRYIDALTYIKKINKSEKNEDESEKNESVSNLVKPRGGSMKSKKQSIRIRSKKNRRTRRIRKIRRSRRKL